MVRLRASHTYRFALLICASFVFTAIGPDNAPWGQSVLVLTAATALLNALLLVAVGVVSGVGGPDQRTVNRQSILGAICFYLLIGMLFTFVYGAVAVLGLGDFSSRRRTGRPRCGCTSAS